MKYNLVLKITHIYCQTESACLSVTCQRLKNLVHKTHFKTTTITVVTAAHLLPISSYVCCEHYNKMQDDMLWCHHTYNTQKLVEHRPSWITVFTPILCTPLISVTSNCLITLNLLFVITTVSTLQLSVKLCLSFPQVSKVLIWLLIHFGQRLLILLKFILSSNRRQV